MKKVKFRLFLLANNEMMFTFAHSKQQDKCLEICNFKLLNFKSLNTYNGNYR